MRKDPQPKKPLEAETPFQRFQRLAKRIVAVPKKQAGEWKKDRPSAQENLREQGD